MRFLRRFLAPLYFPEFEKSGDSVHTLEGGGGKRSGHFILPLPPPPTINENNGEKNKGK